MTANGRPAHHAFPWRRVLGVGLAMTVLAFVLWNLISHFGETQVVPDPTEVPATGPVATPLPTEHSATPVDVATPDDAETVLWEAGSLPAMLDQAPDLLAEGRLPLNDIARYSDISGWMESQGISPPASPAEAAGGAWEDALDDLALPASLREFGLDPLWKQTYGFDLTQVGQVLVVGQAPDVVLLIRGEFDADALMASWVASGYMAVEVEGETVWTLAPGDGIDLSAPESRLSLGSLNNMVLLDDGTLAASARLSRLGSVLRVEHGDADSLAENESIAPLLESGPSVELLDSAILARGTLLQAPPGTQADIGTPVVVSVAASPVALPQEPLVPEMGQVAVVLAGVGPPADGMVPFTLRLVLEDDDVAEATAAMIDQRLRTGASSIDGRSWDEVLGATGVLAIDGIVVVDAPQPPADFLWLRLVSERDVGFATWLPES